MSWIPGRRGRRLLRGAAGSFGLSVSAAGLAFLTSIVLARRLGADGVGVYALAMSALYLCRPLATLGLGELTVREVAAAREAGEEGRLRAVVLRVVSWVALSSLVLAALSGLVLKGLGAKVDLRMAEALRLASWMFPAMALTAAFGSVLRGMNRVVLSKVSENLLRPGLFLVLILVGSARLVAGAADQALGLQLAAQLAAFAVAATIALRALPSLRGPQPRTPRAGLLVAALPFLMLEFLLMTDQQLDTLLLGGFRASADVGVYRAALSSARLIAFLHLAANTVLAPTLVRLHSAGRRGELERLLKKAARWVTGVTLLPVVFCWVWGETLLEHLFSSEFVPGAPALAILAGAFLFNAAAGSAGLLLNMTGHERASVSAMSGSLLVHLVLALLLIPAWGATGAAVAAGTSVVLLNVLLVLAARRRLAICPTLLP